MLVNPSLLFKKGIYFDALPTYTLLSPYVRNHCKKIFFTGDYLVYLYYFLQFGNACYFINLKFKKRHSVAAYAHSI